MKQSLQRAIEDELPDANYPDFEPGDKIRVTTTQAIQGQQRKRHFEGVCIARRGEGPDKTFKVRKVSFGVGVERIYPLYSPIIDEIEIVKKGKVRRAKLSYLEGRSAKESRIEEERADLEELNRTRAGVAGPEAEEELESSEEETDEEQAPDDEAVEDEPADEDASEDDEPQGDAETPEEEEPDEEEAAQADEQDVDDSDADEEPRAEAEDVAETEEDDEENAA